jgi:putative NADPH-quinone reductase
MNVLLVYAHPEPASFNGALRDAAVTALTAAGHPVTVSDLYAQGFNPVAGPGDVTVRSNTQAFNLGLEQMHAVKHGTLATDVEAEFAKLLAADLLLLQFPLWWFSLPAILKGWIDRVFVFGGAYDFGRTWDKGVFAGKRAMLSITASAPAAVTWNVSSGPSMPACSRCVVIRYCRRSSRTAFLLSGRRRCGPNWRATRSSCARSKRPRRCFSIRMPTSKITGCVPM